MDRINRIIKRISVLTVCACLAGMVFVQTVFAYGGAYVSNTSVDVAVGDTVYIAVGTDNAAGAYAVSSYGSAGANGSGWLDNESATIGIYGASVGSGTVTIRFDTLATYDSEDRDGTTFEVYVNVYEPEGGAAAPDKGWDGQQAQEQKPAEEETTTAAPEPENKLKVTSNGVTYLVQKDMTGIEQPVGFQITEGSFQGETVKVLKYKDELTLYALRGEADGSIVFMTYDAGTGQFTAPKTLLMDRHTYYLLEIPGSIKSPSGYVKKAVRIGDQETVAFVSEKPDQADIYYIRAMENGTDGYYAYHAKEGTLEKAADFEALLNGNGNEKKAASTDKKTGLDPIKIAMIAGAILILILVIIIIIVAVRKRRGGNDDGPDDHDDYDDYDRYDDHDRYDHRDDFGDGRSYDPEGKTIDLRRRSGHGRSDGYERDLSDEGLFSDLHQMLRNEDTPDGVNDIEVYENDIEKLIDDENRRRSHS